MKIHANSAIKGYQEQCSKILTSICANAHITPTEFSDVFPKCLDDGKTEEIFADTVQDYFYRKVPQKYIISHKGYTTFKSAIVATITDLCGHDAQAALDRCADKFLEFDKLHEEVAQLKAQEQEKK